MTEADEVIIPNRELEDDLPAGERVRRSGVWVREVDSVILPPTFRDQCARYRDGVIDEAELVASVSSFVAGAEAIGKKGNLFCLIRDDIRSRPSVGNVLADYALRSLSVMAQPDVFMRFPHDFADHINWLAHFLKQSNRLEEYDTAVAKALDTVIPAWCADTAGIKHAEYALEIISRRSSTNKAGRLAQLEVHRASINSALQKMGENDDESFRIGNDRGSNIACVAVRFGGGKLGRNGQWQRDGEPVDAAIHAMALPIVSQYIADAAAITQQTARDVIDSLLVDLQPHVHQNQLPWRTDSLGTDGLGIAIQIVNALTAHPIDDSEALAHATKRMVEIYQEHHDRLETPQAGYSYTLEHLGGYVQRQALPEVAGLLQPNRDGIAPASAPRSDAACDNGD